MAWTLNRNEMIERALRMCGVVSLNANPTVKMYQLGADAINEAIEDMHNDGITLLQVSEDSESTVASTASYTLDADVEDVLAVWVQTSTNNDEPLMRLLSRHEYYSIPDKASEGTPYQCFVEYSNPRKLILYHGVCGI